MRADYLTESEYQHIRRIKSHAESDGVYIDQATLLKLLKQEPEPAPAPQPQKPSIFSRSFYDPQKVQNLINLKPDKTQKIGLLLLIISPIGFYLSIQAIFSQTL